MLSDDIYDIVMNFVFFMSLVQKNMFLSKKPDFFRLNKRRSVGKRQSQKFFLDIESLKNLNALASPKHHNFVIFDQFTCSNSYRVTS